MSFEEASKALVFLPQLEAFLAKSVGFHTVDLIAVHCEHRRLVLTIGLLSRTQDTTRRSGSSFSTRTHIHSDFPDCSLRNSTLR